MQNGISGNVYLGQDLQNHWPHFGWEILTRSKSPKDSSRSYFLSKDFFHVVIHFLFRKVLFLFKQDIGVVFLSV